MMDVWAVAEHARVASGAAELAIFTAILYWFFTSSRVADMLEVVGERVGGWCGREPPVSLRAAVRSRRPKHDVYAKLDADNAVRQQTLYRAKEGIVVPAPQPVTRPPAGLACARCAPLSRDSWQDPKHPDTGSVINILNIGRQTFANGGVVSRYLCDIAQCCHLTKFHYKDIVPSVMKDQRFQKAIEDATQEELNKIREEGGRGSKSYPSVRKRVEAKAMKVLNDISSAMSTNVLKLVAWLCHKAIRRVAIGCGTRAACIERLRRANAAGLPLIFVPLHRSHFDYILVTFTLYLTGIRPPLVAAGDNMRIPFFGWFLRGCGAFYIRRRVDGSEYHGDPIYTSALRAYILNSLAENNNLEFFIEGGRTRTGKPQPPKAGILSVILDAYLDGTIDDALLVPVTLNYDRLVDGNFVREQLGMPKQMETFWSALRGIWRTLNTNHGAIRVDFNQPSSLKELVQSFKKYNYMKSSIERPLLPPNNNLSVPLQMASNHSHSSLYGEGVSDEHKMMVEAIGRHLVYDASQATALMCTNVVCYVLMTEQRGGCSLKQLHASVEARHSALTRDARDLYVGDVATLVKHALDMLGRGLVSRSGSGDKQAVRPQGSIAACLELAYYANTVVAHYAATAICVTALETLVLEEGLNVNHDALVSRAMELSCVLSHEFVLSAPCTRLQETVLAAIDTLVLTQVISNNQKAEGLEEDRWCRRFAQSLDEELDENERPDPTRFLTYTVNTTPQAIAERRRLLLSIRPLLEGYAATCRGLAEGPQKQIVKNTLDHLTEEFTQNRMKYGEAVSVDAIRNCHRLLKQWGVIDIYSEGRERKMRICAPYDNPQQLSAVCDIVCKFNVQSPLLNDQ